MGVKVEREKLEKIEKDKKDIQNEIRKHQTLYEQKQKDWHLIFNNIAWHFSKYLEDYIFKNQQNLFYDYNTEEWIFIYKLNELFQQSNIKPDDLNKKYQNIFLVFYIKKSVKIKFRTINTITTNFNKYNFFKNLVKKPDHHKIRTVKHKKFFRDFRMKINNYIMKNSDEINYIVNLCENKKVIDSFFTILERDFNDIYKETWKSGINDTINEFIKKHKK